MAPICREIVPHSNSVIKKEFDGIFRKSENAARPHPDPFMAYQNGSLPRPVRNAPPGHARRAGARGGRAAAHPRRELERELAQARAGASQRRPGRCPLEGARAGPGALPRSRGGPRRAAAGPNCAAGPRDLSSCLAVVCAVTGARRPAPWRPPGGHGGPRRRATSCSGSCGTTSLGLAAIGEPLGRDHATVAHGINRCAAAALALGLDPEPDNLVDAVRALWEAEWCKVGPRVGRTPSRGRLLAEAARPIADEAPAVRDGEGA